MEVGCLCLTKWFVDEATNQPLLRFTWFPLTKPHLPHMPHHSSPEQVLHRAPRTEGQTKVKIPPNSSKWGLNKPHTARRHCGVPTELCLSPQKLLCVIWCWLRGSAVSTGLLHLCTHHLGAFFPLHAAAGFLLHMFNLPQLEAVRGSLNTLYTQEGLMFANL